jgi:hypothetical protein
MGSFCTATINFENHLTDNLICSDYNLENGKWERVPEQTLSTNDSGILAVAVSKDCEMIGPEGTIKYSYADGTIFTIQFNAPYGGSENTLYCNPSGPRAGIYNTPVNPAFGTGNNVSGTVIIQPK